MESNEFGTCYEYSDDAPPKEINCSFKIFDQTVFFGMVIRFIVGGIICLIKGAKGDWDNKVKPEDMVGPGIIKMIIQTIKIRVNLVFLILIFHILQDCLFLFFDNILLHRAFFSQYSYYKIYI